VSFALVALVTLIGGVLFARGNSTDIGLLYLIPVMYAGTRHGLATGVVVGLASSLAYNFFFIPPTHTLSVDNPEHFITLLILLGWRWSAASLPRACGSRRCWRKRGPIATPRWPVSRAGSRAEPARRCVEWRRRVARLFDVRTIVLVRARPRRATMAWSCARPLRPSTASN
jgi:two-component system sensor histidine kinase KdpD